MSKLISLVCLLSLSIATCHLSVTASGLEPHQSLSRRNTRDNPAKVDRTQTCPAGCPADMNIAADLPGTISDATIKGKKSKSAGVVFTVQGDGASYRDFKLGQVGAEEYNKACLDASMAEAYEAYKEGRIVVDTKRYDYHASYITGCLPTMCTTTQNILIGSCTLVQVDRGTYNNPTYIDVGKDLSHLALKQLSHVYRVMSVKDIGTVPEQLQKTKHVQLQKLKLPPPPAKAKGVSRRAAANGKEKERPGSSDTNSCKGGCPINMSLSHDTTKRSRKVSNHDVKGQDVVSGVVFFVQGEGASYKDFAQDQPGFISFEQACIAATERAEIEAPFKHDPNREYQAFFNVGCFESMCTTTTGVLVGYCNLMSFDKGTELENVKIVDTGVELSHYALKEMVNVHRLKSVKDISTVPAQLMRKRFMYAGEKPLPGQP